MSNRDVIVGVALEDAPLTLEQLAAACAVEPDWVIVHVSEGRFPAVGGTLGEWRFTSGSLRRARRMRQVERDYEAAPELAALVADLLEEMDSMRARLGRRGGSR